jgi:hypothetical protein
MKKRLIAGLWTLAVLSIPNVAQAQTAKDILKKVVEANGGEETLKKYPAAKVAMKGTMDFMGMEVPIKVEGTYQIPGLKKSTITMEILGQKVSMVQIYNNGKGKMTVNGMNFPLMDAVKEEMKEESNLQMITSFFPLLDTKKFDVSVIEKPEKVDDKEVVGLLVKSKDRKDVKLYFDPKSFMCVKIARRALSPQQKEADEETILKDYKKFKGIPTAMKATVLMDGKKFMDTEVTEVEPLEKVDMKEFDVSD